MPPGAGGETFVGRDGKVRARGLRVLCLPRYTPLLAQSGVSLDVVPFFTDAHLGVAYSRSTLLQRVRKVCLYVGSVASRLLTLRRARRYDLLWVQTEAVPFFPLFVENMLRKSNIPVVVDYDDAVQVHYERLASDTLAKYLHGRIAAVMASSSMVVVGNSYLAQYARRLNSSVAVIPSCIDTDKYHNLPAGRGTNEFVVGWIGTPLTARYLAMLGAPLRRLALECDLVVHAVGVADLAIEGVRTRCLPWAEETEARDVAGFDVGVMPLPDDDFTRGKCGVKLLQYMAAGVPGVASPVGVNSDIVVHGANGMLARTDEDWYQCLRTLALDAGARTRLGEEARRTVESEFSLKARFSQLSEVLMTAARQ